MSVADSSSTNSEEVQSVNSNGSFSYLPTTDSDISDREFATLLENLRSIRSFMWQQSVQIDSIKSFGVLNKLTYHPDGRPPTDEEWLFLELQAQGLFSIMTPALRTKFLGTIPKWFGALAGTLIVLSLAALFFGLITVHYTTSLGQLTLLSYILYVVSLGGTGSIAFIAMNALAVQNDITFDLLEERLLILRIVLGALFAVIFSLPFGFPHYLSFLRALVSAEIAGVPTTAPVGEVTELLTTQALLLVLPFLLGFSTTLVILVFNRFVGAVQSFFGAQPPSTTATTVAATPQVQTGVRVALGHPNGAPQQAANAPRPRRVAPGGPV